MPPATQLLSFALLMLLVVSTGTAWFVAMHPQFIWRLIQGESAGGDPPAAHHRALRFAGVMCGAAGLLMLLVGDLKC